MRQIIFCSATCRHIEIFRSNLSEALAAVASLPATCRYIEILRSNFCEARAAEARVPRGGGGEGGRGGGSERMEHGGGHSGGAQPYVVTHSMLYSPLTTPRLQGNISPGQMRHGVGYMQRRGELAVHDSTIVIVISISLFRFKSPLLIVLYGNFFFSRRTLHARRLGWTTAVQHGTKLWTNARVGTKNSHAWITLHWTATIFHIVQASFDIFNDRLRGM